MNQSSIPVILAVLFLFVPAAHAQSLGGKTVQIVVPAAAGGPSDFIVRVIAPKLSEALNQKVIVENRAGPNGVIGAEYAARAAPDGSTLAIGNSGTHAINAALYRKLPYDPQRDFAPISQLAASSMILVSHPRFAANTVQELIAEAKREPGKLNIAIAGASGQLAGEALKAQTQIALNNVPYKGGAPATLAVMSGEVELVFVTFAAAIGNIKAGKLKPLGLTGAKRSPLLPEVPTIAESGVAGYDFEIWHGLFAPARTPEQIVRTVHREVVRILNIPEIRDRIAPRGYEIVASTPEQFAAAIKRDIGKYRKIVTEAAIPLEGEQR